MFVCGECGERTDRPGRCGADGGALEAATDPLLGTEVARYRLARLLGAGGMGRVYLGVQPAIGSRVAIKLLADDVADDREQLDRFFAEARAVNLIRHENIVNILDLDRLPSGRPYIVMEHIAGTTLRDIVGRGPAAIGGSVHVMVEVLLALDAAHAKGIIHRDLKPDNIMVTASGHAKVLDFGIAKLANRPGPRTVSGVALGTPHYMAPEQINAEAIDARTDVYAAGCVLFELLAGRRPFDGTTDYQLMHAHLNDPVPSVCVLRPEVPPMLDAVIVQALAKEPAARFASAKAMARALRQVASALPEPLRRPLVSRTSLPALRIPTSAPPNTAEAATVSERGPRAQRPSAAPPAAPRRRSRAVIAAAAITAAVAGVIVVLATSPGTREEPATAPAPAPAPPPIAVTAPPEPGPTAVLSPEGIELSGPTGSIKLGRGGLELQGSGPGAPKLSFAAPGTDVEEAKPAGARTETDRPRKKPTPPAPSANATTPTATTAPSGQYVTRTATKIQKRIDFDPKRFDAFAFRSRAAALAHALAPNVKLSEFEASDVGPDGKSDLRRRSNGYAKYYFRSTSAPCEVWVIVNDQLVSAWIDSDRHCPAPKPAPTCTFTQIYARAVATRQTFEGEKVRIDWTGSGWNVQPDDYGIQHLDDNCTKPVAGAALAVPVVKQPATKKERRKIEKPFPDAKRFEPVAYVAAATQLARQLEPDAQLVEIRTSGVTKDGTINGFKVYAFRSDKAIRSSDPDRINCLDVTVQPWDEPVVRASESASRCERKRGIATPKCSVPQVVAKFADQLTGETWVSYDHGGWDLRGGGIQELQIRDDCK